MLKLQCLAKLTLSSIFMICPDIRLLLLHSFFVFTIVKMRKMKFSYNCNWEADFKLLRSAKAILFNNSFSVTHLHRVFCTINAASKSIILSCAIFLYENLKNYSIQSFKECLFFAFCLSYFSLLSNNIHLSKVIPMGSPLWGPHIIQ